MSTGYQIKDQYALYFLTFQVVDWVDIFTRPIHRDIVLDSLRFCQNKKGLQVFGYVVMSNHVHLIANHPKGKLSDTIRDLKKYTARTIINTVKENNESRREWILDRFLFNGRKHSRNKDYQLWTHENHAVVLYSNSFIWEKLEYIHNNPVRAMIVEQPEDYLYSSARNYAGMKSLMDVVLLDPQLITY
jgi:REP element-mobilizing transposase RayT